MACFRPRSVPGPGTPRPAARRTREADPVGSPQLVAADSPVDRAEPGQRVRPAMLSSSFLLLPHVHDRLAYLSAPDADSAVRRMSSGPRDGRSYVSSIVKRGVSRPHPIGAVRRCDVRRLPRSARGGGGCEQSEIAGAVWTGRKTSVLANPRRLTSTTPGSPTESS